MVQECSHDHMCGHGSAAQSLEETLFTSRQSIHHAVIESDVSHVKALLDAAPHRVHEVDAAGYVPVLYAKSAVLIELLIARGADIHACTRDGQRTALHRAAVRGDSSLVKVLLDLGAKDVQDVEGQFARDLAGSRGHQDIAQLILDSQRTRTAQ